MRKNLLHAYLQKYRRTLIDDVVPFWLKYGIDRKYGGISNVCDDDGKVLSYDKYIWSQGRALWTFSALYNRVEKRDEWLSFAKHIFDYLVNHGRDERGYWMYRLDKDGNVLDRDISIYADGFVLNGMGEYYQATGDESALNIALETYKSTLERINNPGSYSITPYTIPPGMKTLGVPMIFSFFFYNLGEITRRNDICRNGLKLASEILNDFHVPGKNAIMEFVGLDGKYIDAPEGRICIPGHGVEALWFLITIFARSGNNASMPQCCDLIKRHLELGWDAEFAGIRLAIDIDGQEPPAWKQPDCKPWWVHLEALVATMYAYLYAEEQWCVDWHEKIYNYAFKHFPRKNGEWTQWLDRYGNITKSAALPVKDPFHLPRALVYLTTPQKGN